MEDKKKTWTLVLLLVGVVAVGFLGWQLFGGGPGSATNPPAVEYEKQPPSDGSRYRGGG